MEPDDIITKVNIPYNYEWDVNDDDLQWASSSIAKITDIMNSDERVQKSVPLRDFIRDQIPFEDRNTMMVEWEEAESRGVIPDEALLRKWNAEYRSQQQPTGQAKGTLLEMRELIYEVYRIQATQVFTTQL